MPWRVRDAEHAQRVERMAFSKCKPRAFIPTLALLAEMLHMVPCADLSSDLAECAIERFAEANFSRINNKSGFLMVRCPLSACRLPAPALTSVWRRHLWLRLALKRQMGHVHVAMRRASSAA